MTQLTKIAALNGRPWLTVLMPAYNEAAGLEAAVRLVVGKLEELGLESELLVVDDASRDATAEIAERLATEFRCDELSPPAQLYAPTETASRLTPLPCVRVVHHAQNRGIGGGFRTGVAEARGEWMILIPADLALDLDDLPLYFAAAQEADIVVGVSPLRSDYTPFRRLVSRANIQAIATLFRLPLRQFNYISMYKTSWLRRIEIEYTQSAFFFAEVLVKCRDLGARLVEVETTYLPRETGQATGANRRLIATTARDMARYWVRWVGGRVA